MINLHNPRLALLRAIIIDFVGAVVILALISILAIVPGRFITNAPLTFDISWVILCLLVYFGWG